MTTGAADRFLVRRNPLRMFCSSGPWVATAYLAGYVVVGSALYAVSFVALVVTALLALFTFGVPLLAGSALVLRGCAEVERLRSRLATTRISVNYQEITEPGVLASVRTRWGDPVTWRDVAYLVLLYVPLLALDAVTLLVWVTLLAGITLPIWYRAAGTGAGTGGSVVGFVHNGPHAIAIAGYWPADLLTAVLVALVSLILSLCGAYLVVAAARLHRWVAATLLGPYIDPLAEAKQVLLAPGPLGI